MALVVGVVGWASKEKEKEGATSTPHPPPVSQPQPVVSAPSTQSTTVKVGVLSIGVSSKSGLSSRSSTRTKMCKSSNFSIVCLLESEGFHSVRLLSKLVIYWFENSRQLEVRWWNLDVREISCTFVVIMKRVDWQGKSLEILLLYFLDPLEYLDFVCLLFPSRVSDWCYVCLQTSTASGGTGAGGRSWSSVTVGGTGAQGETHSLPSSFAKCFYWTWCNNRLIHLRHFSWFLSVLMWDRMCFPKTCFAVFHSNLTWHLVCLMWQ